MNDAQFPKYMMATKAFHQLGEISSSEPDICVVQKIEGENYIGNWVFGLGFFGVKFPIETTRDLTPEDVEKYNGMQLSMCGAFSGKHSYDCGSINIT